MKKVFKVLLTLMLAISLCGVAVAEDVSSQSLNIPAGYEEAHQSGSATDVTYTVGDKILVTIPSDIKFIKDVYYLESNVTVMESVIGNNEYLNVYARSHNGWNMFFVIGNGLPPTYDDTQFIEYNMKFDSNRNQVLDETDLLITSVTDSITTVNGQTRYPMLSLQGGINTYDCKVKFTMVQNNNIRNSGEYHDWVIFSFDIGSRIDAVAVDLTP